MDWTYIGWAIAILTIALYHAWPGFRPDYRAHDAWVEREIERYKAEGLIYYDPDEVLPATPQPWGIDDYQPWPGHQWMEGEDK